MARALFLKMPPARAKAISACLACRKESNDSAAILNLVSVPDKGTTVQVAIPLDQTSGNTLAEELSASNIPMKKPEKIRILIADDHYIVRMGLIALVNTEPDMEVVAEAADGVQALELFGRCNPDLALLDMRMPIKNGIQATMEIRPNFPLHGL